MPPTGWQPRGYPLPELFVTGMADGGDGTIWLATLDGLYRFDGFAAHRVPGYPFSRAAHLLRGPDGAIWIGGADGLAVYRGSFQVVVRDEGKAGVSRLSTDGKAVYFRYDQKLWRIDAMGKQTLVIECEIGSGASPVAGGGILYVCADGHSICQSPSGLGTDSQILDAKPESKGDLWFRVAEDSKGTTWTCSREWLYQRRKGERQFQKVRPKRASEDAIRLERLPNGEVGVLGEAFESLTHDVSLIVPGNVSSARATAATSDSKGNVWVAYRPYGLVRWRKDLNPEWMEAQGSRVSRRQDPYRQLFDTGWLAPDDKRVDFAHRLNGLVRVDANRLLALTVKDGVWVIEPDGKKIVLCNWPDGPVVGLTMGLRDRGGRIWLGGDIGLYEVVDWETAPRIEKRPIADGVAIESVQDMALDTEGRLWVAHTKGLCFRQGEGWGTFRFAGGEKGIGSLAMAGQSMWVTSFAPGFFARLDREGAGWKENRFALANGYGNVKSVWVQVDSRGWIWRAKDDGVMVAQGGRTGPLDWLELNSAKGFDLGRLRKEGFAELPDGRVWLMGLRQSMKLKPEAAWFQLAVPGAKPLMDELLVTPQGVTVQVGGLGSNDLLEYPIQYRLRPLFERWRGSKDGRLEFRDLRDGDYHLEVRFGGDDKASVLEHDFQVGKRRTIAWGWIGGALVAGALALWGISRTLWVRRWRHQRAKARFVKKQESADLCDFPEPGEVVQGRYEIVREAAIGGFSRVFEAVRREDGLRIAIKMVALRRGQESWLRARYAHELAALGSVDDVGVVKLLDSWVGLSGELVLVMPFVEGVSLRDLLSKGRVNSEDALLVLEGVARALEAIHRVGMVHLDLKPENILLAEGMRPVLIDLGTSGFRGSEDELTMTRMLTGSAPYMAPERLTGHYSTASDVFSLGVVALELFSGRQTVDFALGWYEPGFQAELTRCLEDRWAERAGALAALLIEALQPSPRLRPSSASEWVNAIRKIADDR